MLTKEEFEERWINVSKRIEQTRQELEQEQRDWKELAKQVQIGEADLLRRRFAKYLAPAYLENPLKIANICDEELDCTGTLLGFVRDEARQLKSNDG